MWNGEALVRQRSEQITQSFAALHSSTVIVRKMGVGALPPEKNFRTAFSATLENALLEDGSSSRILINCLSLNLRFVTPL